MVTGLDIRYDVGPGDHPLLGRRLPNVELAGDPGQVGHAPAFGQAGHAPAFELLRAGRGIVLDLAGDDEVRAAAAPWADRIEIISAAGSLESADAVLVRPDGYIAWIGSGGSGPDGLPEALRRWFGHPRGEREDTVLASAGSRPGHPEIPDYQTM
jgi:bifunctional hydroxylase/dehydrase